MQHTVNIIGEMCDVAVHQSSRTVWIAAGCSRERLIACIKVRSQVRFAGYYQIASNRKRERFHVWKVPFKLAKAGPILQRRPSKEMEASEEEAQQLIQILDIGASKAKPLIDLPNTVSHHLAQLKYQVLRVYYLPPANTDNKVFDEIKARLK